MLQPLLSRAALVFLASALAVLSVACGEDKRNTANGGNEQAPSIGGIVAMQPTTKPATSQATPEAQPLEPFDREPSFFEQGLDKAVGAWSISQSAQSPEDWNLVASQYQDAIALMQQVRRQSPEFAIARKKIREYRREIRYAQQKAAPSPLPQTATQFPGVVVTVPQTATTPNFTPPPAGQTKLFSPRFTLPSSELPTPQQVFTAPIRRRSGGTPIVTVTFNGQRQFEMIVDTGASGTVITQQMANALGVVPVGRAKANTASSKAVEFPIGYVDSMEVGGVTVNKVPVAIAGNELDTGLLGHDFFGNYDVTIKRNVVEFRPQSHSQINPVETGLISPTSTKPRQFVESP